MVTLTIELTEADYQRLVDSAAEARRFAPALEGCWTPEREAAAIVASAVRGRMITDAVAFAAHRMHHAAPPHSAPQRDVAATNAS